MSHSSSCLALHARAAPGIANTRYYAPKAAIAVPFYLFIDFLHRSELFFQLHSTILEPNFDLPLSQTEGMCYFDPSSAGQVVVKVELLLKFERLEAGVRLSASSTGTSVWT